MFILNSFTYLNTHQTKQTGPKNTNKRQKGKNYIIYKALLNRCYNI